MSTTMKQPLPVQGYKPQSQATIDLVNEGKELEERVLRYTEKIDAASPDVDPRWLAIGRTDIQKGFMAVFRAVFQPKRASLPEDAE